MHGQSHPPQEALRSSDAEVNLPRQCRRAYGGSKVEHVFAHQKARMRMVIRTIDLKRAQAAITLANIAYNLTRWRWLNSRTASA